MKAKGASQALCFISYRYKFCSFGTSKSIEITLHILKYFTCYMSSGPKKFGELVTLFSLVVIISNSTKYGS
jgi:hypothetical protein